jgi:hypothetical protein
VPGIQNHQPNFIHGFAPIRKKSLTERKRSNYE